LENYIFDSSLAHARLYRLDFVKKIHTGTPEKTDGGDGLPIPLVVSNSKGNTLCPLSLLLMIHIHQTLLL